VSNKDIWDFVMVCSSTHGNNKLKILLASDNYFICGFYPHSGELIQFKIEISHILTNLWSDDNDMETHSYDIEAWSWIDHKNDKSLLSEYLLKQYLKPIIRECKLNSIGI